MTEARIAALAVQVEHLATYFARHEEKDEKGFKYAHNMLENALDKLAGLERSVSYYEGERVMRGEAEKQKVSSMDKLNERLQTIERQVWIAIGGVGAVAALATFFGWNILKILGK
jgi:hypothetical protein